jgi:hypothetical protein
MTVPSKARLVASQFMIENKRTPTSRAADVKTKYWYVPSIRRSNCVSHEIKRGVTNSGRRGNELSLKGDIFGPIRDRERFLQFRATILKRVYEQEGGRMLAGVASGRSALSAAAPRAPSHLANEGARACHMYF